MGNQEFIRVPYGLSVHGEEEIEAILTVLRTSTQMGPRVQEFETKIAHLFAKRHGIMVNSGSSANHLAIEILGLPSGSEVITPALTFATTVAPLVKHGLVPAFVDVVEGTYNIDPSRIDEMVTAKTKAMMVPSLVGNMPDWDVINAIAGQYGLSVIEDSADTLGATLRGSSTGLRSDISTTSFYGSHVINCAGNGGMLCVNDDQLAAKAKLLRSWGRSSSVFVDSENIESRFSAEVDGIAYDAKFVFSEIGYNFEPSEMGAAFGLVQLRKLEHNIEARISNFRGHLSFFEEYEEFFILPTQQPDARTGWLAFALTIRDSAPFRRREFQTFLERRNIQTRTVFTGNILRQPAFTAITCKKSRDGYPHADQVMRGGVLIACHHGLEPRQIEHIHESVRVFLRSA